MHLGGPSNKIDASIQHAGKLRLRGYTGSLVTKTILELVVCILL